MTTTIQYVTDETGEKTAVLLSISDYQRIIEGIEDLADIVDRRGEPTISHEEFLARLRKAELGRSTKITALDTLSFCNTL